MDAMFWIVIATLGALVVLMALALRAHSVEAELRADAESRNALERTRERREYREHIERLERIIAARNVAEAAAVERVYSSPPMGEETKPREPDEIDQLYADPPRRKPKGDE